MTKRLYLGASLVAILAIAFSAITLTSHLTSAQGGGGDGDGDGQDQPITGAALADCTAAALAVNPGGTVTETEVTVDEDAPDVVFGVEIRLADGSQVEVNLDADCNVIGQEVDEDGPNDS